MAFNKKFKRELMHFLFNVSHITSTSNYLLHIYMYQDYEPFQFFEFLDNNDTLSFITFYVKEMS